MSAQSLWKRVREGGIRGLDMFVADATYVLAVLEKQGEEAGGAQKAEVRQRWRSTRENLLNATLGAAKCGIDTALRFKCCDECERGSCVELGV